jgi:hypothetical protein
MEIIALMLGAGAGTYVASDIFTESGHGIDGNT